jgi:hypothetical protein
MGMEYSAICWPCLSKSAVRCYTADVPSAVTNELQIECSFTSRSLDEIARFGRRWYYWLAFYLKGSLGLIFLGALVVAFTGGFVQNLVGHSPKQIVYATFYGLPLSALLWYFRHNHLRVTHERAALLARLNPIRLAFSSAGITYTDSEGHSSFVPWSAYSKFREGRYIFALRARDSGAHHCIPKDSLPEQTSEEIRCVLLANLPENQ